MKKLILSLLLGGSALFCQAQSTINTKEISNVPSGVSYEGDMVAARTWADANGTNYFVMSRTPDKQKKDKYGNPAASAALYAYHYAVSGGETKLLRKIQDFVNDCALDLRLEFVEDALWFTDLDGDKAAEITFIYRLACSGDVSGPEQKLMLLESGDKYAIRGFCSLAINGDILSQGETKIGGEFDKATKFKSFAKKCWDENSVIGYDQ